MGRKNFKSLRAAFPFNINTKANAHHVPPCLLASSYQQVNTIDLSQSEAAACTTLGFKVRPKQQTHRERSAAEKDCVLSSSVRSLFFCVGFEMRW